MKTKSQQVTETATILTMIEVGTRILNKVAGNDIADSLGGKPITDISGELIISGLGKELPTNGGL